jgi:hypothetical protein
MPLCVIEVLELNRAGIKSFLAAKAHESLLQSPVGLEVERVVIDSDSWDRAAARFESRQESTDGSPVLVSEAQSTNGNQGHSAKLRVVETEHGRVPMALGE